MKNITLSADEKLIEAARQEARRRKTTLNAEFREWLARYARSRQAQQRLRDYRRLMDSMKEVSSGRRYTRDELNAR
jgi:hypothetical protein